MQNVNVATTVTAIVAAATRGGRPLLIQNQSDTTMLLAVGATNIAALTASVGLKLEPGETITFTGADACSAISAIHGGSGSKVAHWQEIGA